MNWLATSCALASVAISMAQLLMTDPILGPLSFGVLTVGLALTGLAFAWTTRHPRTAVIAVLVLIVGAGTTGAFVTDPVGTNPPAGGDRLAGGVHRPIRLRIDRQPVASRCATFAGTGEASARQTLWLTVRSDQPKYYFYPVVASPHTYRWWSRDVELGTEVEQAGEPYEVGIAQVDEPTSTAISNKEHSQGVTKLPGGIEIVDEIAVRRNADTRPCRK